MPSLGWLPMIMAVIAPHGSTARREDLRALTREYVAAYGTRSSVTSFAHIPSFSRQTGLPCTACHTAFPQLTPFGRLFKLNGYTLTGLQVVRAGDSGKRETLKIDLIPPVSTMAQASFTQTKRDVPGTQNGDVELPQELSIFLGEEITPRLGTFLQFTYEGASGSIGVDNVDIRYADHLKVRSKDLLYGLTLNNNPGVQDVWNTVPTWRFPFASSSVAPVPGAAALVEEGLAQDVAGLGAYALWNNHVYGEFSLYRSAHQGGAHPPDSTSSNTVRGVGPYWRAFVQHQWGPQAIMVGTFGMYAKLYPAGVAGPQDRFTDVALDAQYERRLGRGNFNAHASWIHERQHLDAEVAAGAAANAANTLKTLRVDASASTASRFSFALGYFTTTGTADDLRYPAEAVLGSALGSPNSTGVIGEVSAMPWLNTRFALQYVAYRKFNGARLNYDAEGRNASDNNTVYLLAWLVF